MITNMDFAKCDVNMNINMDIDMDMDIVKCNVNKFDKHINLLQKIAQHSSLMHKHSACIFKRNKIYTFGYNKCVREEFIQNQNVKFTIHAEIDAICKINIRECKGMDILIIRLGNPNTNKLRNSRPCNSCIQKLLQRGIRRVYYSDKNGDIVYEDLKSMKLLHVSSGHQFFNLSK